MNFSESIPGSADSALQGTLYREGRKSWTTLMGDPDDDDFQSPPRRRGAGAVSSGGPKGKDKATTDASGAAAVHSLMALGPLYIETIG